MSEQEPLEPGSDPESLEDELDLNEQIRQLQEGLVRDWESRELALNAERLGELVPKVTVTNLADHPVRQGYKLDYLVALVERNGEVQVDQTEFAKLNDLQQRYVLNHELGHALDWRLRQIQHPSYANLRHLADELAPEEISYYAHWLDQKLDNGEGKSAKIGQERMAELFSQYLTSDGTFPGMFKMKLLQFNGDHEHWSKIPELEASLASLEEFHADDENEQMAFFQTNPELQSHYQIWQSLDFLCRNEGLMAQIADENNNGEDREDYDDERLEYEALVSQMASRTQFMPEPIPANKKPPGVFSFLAELINLSRK